jgi:acyl dehydratase
LTQFGFSVRQHAVCWSAGLQAGKRRSTTCPPEDGRYIQLLNPMPTFVLKSLQSLKDFVGREIGTTEWMSVTQERIQQFAEATGDSQWIHVDPQRAQRESPYGAAIAHGFLTLSLMSHFLREVIQLPGEVRQTINYGLNRVRFPSAVRAGEKIRARVRLQSFKELSDSVETIFEITVEAVSGDKPCCVAEWILRYYS